MEAVLRVSVRLVEAANGRQLWADRYDATLPAQPDTPEREAIAAHVAHSLAVQISKGLTLERLEVPPTFRRDGALWMLAFAGVSAQIAHYKGFLDLQRLLVSPGTEVHCLELADRPLDNGRDAPVLDDRARREVGERIREVHKEIEDADAAHDIGRAGRAREELDQLVEHLTGALGLHGRARQLGSATERARSTVTWRIRSAIKKVAAVHPRLGRHLENAVRTGTFCGYEPETPTIWTL